MTENPIHLFRGAVVEQATDIGLPNGPGSWSFSRSYDSGLLSRLVSASGGAADKEIFTALGYRWHGSKGPYMLLVDGNIEIHIHASAKRVFTGSGLTPPVDYNATLIELADFEDDNDFDNDDDRDERFNFFRLVEHDSGRVYHFFSFDADIDPESRGRLREGTNRDYLSAELAGVTFQYVAESNANGTAFIVNVVPGYPLDSQYAIDVEYISSFGPLISAIQIKKNSVVVRRAEYTYAEVGATPTNSDIGAFYDLVQVKVLERASTDAGSTLSTIHCTQYRYYRSGGTDDGHEHQLKMVFDDDAIARVASAGDSAVDTPEEILTKSDSYAVASGSSLASYASRSFKYYTGDEVADGNITTTWGTENLQTKYGGAEADEHRTYSTVFFTGDLGLVKEETIRGSCVGCTGGGGGVVKQYHYLERTSSNANAVTRIVVEDTNQTDGVTEAYRTIYGLNNSGALLRKAVIDNPTAGTLKAWCHSITLNAQLRVAERRLPSAHTLIDTDTELKDFFDPTNGSNDSNTINPTAGLVYVYDYVNESDSNRRIHDTLAKEGRDRTPYFVSATDYGDGSNNQPTSFVVAEYAYPSPTGVTDRVNTSYAKKTQYAYAFWNDTLDTGLKKVTTTYPSIPSAQNGSAVATTSEAYYDLSGRLRWTKDGEGYVNYYSYHPVTNQRSYAMVDVANPASPAGAITSGSSSWIAWTVSDADDNKPTGNTTGLSLATSQEYDNMGRPTVHTPPGGLPTYTVYEPDRTIVFPAWDASNTKSILPIQVTTLKSKSQGGTVVLVGDLVVETYSITGDSSSVTHPSGLPTGVTGTPARNDFVSWTRNFYRNVNGELVKQLRYHDIPSSNDGAHITNYYVTAFEYDGLGRRKTTVATSESSIDQRTQVEYDDLDRVVKTKRAAGASSVDTGVNATLGTLSTSGYATVSESAYDDGNVGDSHVTSVKAYYGTGTSDNIETLYKRTYRGHVRGVERKNAGTSFTPYTVHDVNWMGQTTATANYTSAPTWPTSYANYVHDGDPAAPDPLASGYFSLTATYYDDLGRAFRTEHYPGTSSSRLQTNSFFDRNGRLVCNGDKYSAHTEYAYNGAGRQYQQRTVKDIGSTKYVSGVFQYRKPLPLPVLSTMLSTSTVGDEGVVEISHSDFDDSGNTLGEHTFELNHSDTDGIDLDSASSYVRRTIYHWYDGADRLKTTADFGVGDENDGATTWKYAAVPARPSGTSTSWTSDADRLVTQYDYDAASGRQNVVKAPGPGATPSPTVVTTKTFYDDLGRRTYVAENWVDFVPTTLTTIGGSSDDKDRVTGWTYNGLGQAKSLIAYNGSSTNYQETRYAYLDLYNASLVTNTIYPDSSETPVSQTASFSTPFDQVRRTYNLDGSLATLVDQRGVEHTYTYNSRRQLEFDKATSVPSGVDTSIRSIKRLYDNRGRLEYVYSYSDAAGSGTVRNYIQNFYYDSNVGAAYTGLLWFASQYHDTVTPFAVAELVHDSTTSGVYNNGLRSRGTSYPNNDFQANFQFGDDNPFANADNLTDRLGRISGLKVDIDGDNGGTGAVNEVSYQYNGVSRLVESNYVQPKVVHRTNSLDGGGANDYSGWDRFGRTTKHSWEKYVVTPPSTTTIDRFNYAYDYAGNRLSRDIPSTLYGTNDRDEACVYDGLRRLDLFEGGTLGGSGTITTKKRAEDWTLDALGNWPTFKQDTNGDGTWELNQTRTHNAANELTTASSWATSASDRAGNMTTIPIPKSPGKSYSLTYDAWNRLVKVYDDDEAEDRQFLEYDGLNRLIVKQTDTSHDGSYDETRHYYYNQDWQVVEERVGATISTARVDARYVWHPQYVDSLALRHWDSNSSGGADVYHYYLQDANYNVTAVVNASGAVVERYAYTPYGEPTVLHGATDADGAVTEWAVDGTSDIVNKYLYTGRERDPETLLQLNRNRFYATNLGRWPARDPLDYYSGLNLYAYVNCKPIIQVDPDGLVDVPGGSVNGCKHMMEVNNGTGIVNDGAWSDPINRGSCGVKYHHKVGIYSLKQEIYSYREKSYFDFWESGGVCNSVSGVLGSQNAGLANVNVSFPKPGTYEVTLSYSLQVVTSSSSGGAGVRIKCPGSPTISYNADPTKPVGGTGSKPVEVTVIVTVGADDLSATVFTYDPAMAHPCGAKGTTGAFLNVSIISIDGPK